jgi:arylsulfatase A
MRKRLLEHVSKRGRGCLSGDEMAQFPWFCYMFLLLFAVCYFALPVWSCAGDDVRREATAQSNIVIILADDMGYGDARTYGGWIDTPNLDRLASQGMKFTDFHASGNVCSPTRAGLLTGRYQQRAGIAGVINADPKVAAHYHGLYPTEVTFAELLRDAGYATAIFGKWHLGYTTNFNPLHHGFDRFRGYVSGNIDYISHYDRMGTYDWWDGLKEARESGYTTHLITQHAVQFMQQNRNRPFCVYIAHEAVHSPYQGSDDPPQRGPDRSQRRGKLDVKRAYRQMMQEMDKGVGQVVATIEELSIERKTLVFFFSDNGANRNGSNGPLRGFKGSNWEGGHREPAIAWWPGRIRPGSICRQLTISLDLMPTLLAAAGTRVPEGHKLDGVNLLPVMLEGKTLGDRQLFWNGRAMREGPWKLILSGRGAKGVGLYNLESDLGEQENLASQYPDRVSRMRAAIEAWKREVTAGATPQRKRVAN